MLTVKVAQSIFFYFMFQNFIYQNKDCSRNDFHTCPRSKQIRDTEINFMAPEITSQLRPTKFVQQTVLLLS